jgi:isoamylase
VIEPGHSDRLGASWDGEGVNFALYSSGAEAVELCLYDSAGRETHRLHLPERDDGIWHGYLPGCAPGQAYGYRVHGPYRAGDGYRFNPSKLLVDPYARELRGELIWRREIFDYDRHEPTLGLIPSRTDSAPYVPKGLVQGRAHLGNSRPGIPWAETVIYETNVRAYTMRHPAVQELDRGTFRGMRHRDVLAYLKALGVTAVELMPVHAFVDEEFLVRRGLKNFWGYNTLGFFAPDQRLLGGGAIAEFRQMVDAIHEQGIEVILDVVYNHTAEGGQLGPTLSFRGIDNATYYRLDARDQSDYINDTGVGNTIDTESAPVQRLILDSLRYWATDMGVDGFRFDLASILGRRASGFDREHPIFAELNDDPVLKDLKLIAEPWDVGPGGYRLGSFPSPWAEWNDQFRDGVRRFWRGDAGSAPELAKRLHGSSDLFELSGRGPTSSVNFVTSHDGYTLVDAVSYERRHNEANGEGNRDGHSHNFSLNYGVEGPADDPIVVARRRRHRLNLLMTTLLAQGTPMLLAGDEFGNSQAGNNNAYAQDNEIGWIDWSQRDTDPGFVELVRELIALRKRFPLVRQDTYSHGGSPGDLGQADIVWFGFDGLPVREGDWHTASSLGLLLTTKQSDSVGASCAVALLLNASIDSTTWTLPSLSAEGVWVLEFATDDESAADSAAGTVTLQASSAAFFTFHCASADGAAHLASDHVRLCDLNS